MKLYFVLKRSFIQTPTLNNIYMLNVLLKMEYY